MISLLVASLLFKGIGFTLKKYFQTKELLVIALYMVIVLVSGIYSENKADWMNWVRIKLPFIALPLAFAPIRQLESKKFVLILYGFMLTFFVCTVLVLGNYFLHFENMTRSFSWGTQIPMPFSHIRYTLMLAFSFFCALYLYKEQSFVLRGNERWLQLAYACFVFLALHILSVRSGLVALYLGLFYLAISEIFKRKQFLIGGTIILMMAILPFIAYKLVPSLHNKLEYMRYDLGQYQKGRINENSDAMRLLSMQIGMQLWHESPYLGVGAGDLETETYRIYAQKYPQISDYNRRLPHNEFIWVLATTGVLGFALFLTAFFYPLMAHRYYQYGLFLILNLMIFSSFFTEDTFEEQMGSGFYLIFLLLLMNHFKRE
jgi:O-antigen ligase